MNLAREEAYRRSHPFEQTGPMQGSSPGSGGTDDGEYDHYNVEGSDPQLLGRRPRRGGPDCSTSTATASPTTSAQRCW